MTLIRQATLAFISIVLILACHHENTENLLTLNDPIDTHSHARPLEARTTHLSLDLDVDFETRVISGTARHFIESNDASQFIVDTRGLNILKVTTNDTDEEVNVTFTDFDPIRGKGLIVPIDKYTRVVTIFYFTDPEAAALGWLDPIQTADKKNPFLFTQGQPILTRTWIPIQDSPGIRFTYEAIIRVPEGMMAVMSATNPATVDPGGEYHFEMDLPIPAYLIALAVGDLKFAPIGERTGVYAEPSLLDESLYEFAEMEQMLETAEQLYGRYPWGRYDLLVLPPSFPFGGMENPKLTFATPTILAGDRSLVSLVAHELAHSWSGNLVTNSTWNDFWLNEGFTVYFERRIMEKIYGEDYTRMLAMLGYQDLVEDVEDLGPDSPDTHLFLNLEGRDPDSAMTDIAYEKGAYFLTMLEQQVGRPEFDRFLRNYFSENKFRAMSTGRFVEYLKTNLLEPNSLSVNIDEWIYSPGIPGNCPVIESDKFEKVDIILGRYADTSQVPELPENWSTQEWLHFVRHLPDGMSVPAMASLDERFGLSDSGNSEIAAAWFQQAIETGYAPHVQPRISHFLTRIGRRKFLLPLYKAYKENGQTELAREIYLQARENYHAVSRKSLDKLLEINASN